MVMKNYLQTLEEDLAMNGQINNARSSPLLGGRGEGWEPGGKLEISQGYLGGEK